MKLWVTFLFCLFLCLTPSKGFADVKKEDVDASIAILRIDDYNFQVNIQNYPRPYRLAVRDGLSIQVIDLIESDYGSTNIQTVVTLPHYMVHPTFMLLDYDTGKPLFGITK